MDPIHSFRGSVWKFFSGWLRTLKRKLYEKEKQTTLLKVQANLAQIEGVGFPEERSPHQPHPDAPVTQHQSSDPFQNEKEKQSMKTKDIYARVIAKMFEVTPEVVEQRLKNTALFRSPEFEVEMPAEEQAAVEKVDVHQLRLHLTSVLDALDISMSKVEKTIKKG